MKVSLKFESRRTTVRLRISRVRDGGWIELGQGPRHGRAGAYHGRCGMPGSSVLAWGIVALLCLVSMACSPDGGPPGPGASPTLLDSIPKEGAVAVPVGTWVVLRFDRALAQTERIDLRLFCQDREWLQTAVELPDHRLVLRPERRLPTDARCVVWKGDGTQMRRLLEFETWKRPLGTVSPSVRVVSNRPGAIELAPIPDDFWTERDASTATGLRLAIPDPVRRDLADTVSALRSEFQGLDGWSPIAPIVLPVSGALAPGSMPRTVAESLDPTATVALVEIDSQRPEWGRRWPFLLSVRTDPADAASEQHTLLIRPARPLRPGGRYAVLVRRGVHAPGGQALRESRRLIRLLGRTPRVLDETDRELAELLAPALRTAREALEIPWSQDDLVFAVTFTVRSLEGIDRDPLALRDAVRAMPGPRLLLDSVEAGRDPARPVAAIVRGRFRTPAWRAAGRAGLARDEEGRPRVLGVRELPFVLALPRSAATEPAPLLVYQHGHPGSADSTIGSRVQDGFLQAGFAVAGFTDLWNRQRPSESGQARHVVIAQALSLLVTLRNQRQVPDDWLQILGEQLAFVAALRELDGLDVLPIASPDGQGEIDLSLPLVYEGVSQGAIHGQSLLAYAPEIEAYSLVAGGARLADVIWHQAADGLIEAIPLAFGDYQPTDLWTTLSLFQLAFDRQDSHLHAALAASRGWRQDGSAGPSLLLTAGRGDSFVPNLASRSLAWVLGPLTWQRAPDAIGMDFPVANGAVRGNLAAGATGAYTEYVPRGADLPVTPGCDRVDDRIALLREGHFCAQLATESVRRRVTFLRSAVDGPSPIAIDPITPNGAASSAENR